MAGTFPRGPHAAASRISGLVELQQPGPRADWYPMLAWLFLFGLATFALMSFRRAIGTTVSNPRDIVAEAERLTGYTPPSRRWIRPTAASLVTWIATMVILTPVNPALAVWVGGVVVLGGALAVYLSMPNPLKIDAVEFDRELQDLLDQYS